MISFKNSTSKNGKFKDVRIVGNEFIDDKTGEIIDLVSVLKKVYGEEIFEMTTTQKVDTDIE